MRFNLGMFDPGRVAYTVRRPAPSLRTCLCTHRAFTGPFSVACIMTKPTHLSTVWVQCPEAPSAQPKRRHAGKLCRLHHLFWDGLALFTSDRTYNASNSTVLALFTLDCTYNASNSTVLGPVRLELHIQRQQQHRFGRVHLGSAAGRRCSQGIGIEATMNNARGQAAALAAAREARTQPPHCCCSSRPRPPSSSLSSSSSFSSASSSCDYL